MKYVAKIIVALAMIEGPEAVEWLKENSFVLDQLYTDIVLRVHKGPVLFDDIIDVVDKQIQEELQDV